MGRILLATYFRTNVLAFGAGIFLAGLLCALIGRTNRIGGFATRLDKTAYRYASIAIAVVMLVVRSQPAWVATIHTASLKSQSELPWAWRSTVIWPERETAAGHRYSHSVTDLEIPEEARTIS